MLTTAVDRMGGPSGSLNLAESLTQAIYLLGNVSGVNNVGAYTGRYGTVVSELTAARAAPRG